MSTGLYRRKYENFSIPLVVLLLLGLFFVAPGSAADRPNVLIICADDHAPYVMGAYGNTQVRTPNLDRLAASGMRFDRAYANSPVCTASRQSLITGRYPRTIGVTQLRTALPESETTLAEMLGEKGYDTAAIGKMHFNSAATHGFDLRIDHAEHRAWLKEKGAEPLPVGVEVQPPWRPFKDHARTWLNSAALPYGATDADMPGTYFAREAEKYLAADREQPFFLMVSFYEPHSPFHFPVEFAGRHTGSEFPVDRVQPADQWQVPAIFADLTDDEKRGIIAAYYTSVEYMDRNVGIVLDALEASGHADDTIVVYLGDHGYSLGQHGRFEKHCSFEPAVRAPLVIRYPGVIRCNQSTSALVEFIDVAPTLLDLCNVDIPAAVQGRSLVPLLRGQTRQHREQVVVEYSENEEAMIRTDRWKLVYITGNRLRDDGYLPEHPRARPTVALYDELEDPDELTNLANAPEHAATVYALLNQLADHMRTTARVPEDVPESTDPSVVLAYCLQPRDVGGE